MEKLDVIRKHLNRPIEVLAVHQNQSTFGYTITTDNKWYNSTLHALVLILANKGLYKLDSCDLEAHGKYVRVMFYN